MIFPLDMDIDLRKLLSDPKLSELFQSQSGLNDDELKELLDENDPSTFWQWLGARRGQAVPIICLNRNWHLLVGFWFSAPKVRPDPVG